MRIIQFKENQKEIWNKFIAEKNSESFLQSWEWGNFQKSLGRRVWRMGIVEDGGFHSGDSPVEPKMQDLHMRFHSPNGTMEPSESQINSKFKIQNSNLIAVALIVRYDLPFGKSYFYCPRGPVIDGNWKLEIGKLENLPDKKSPPYGKEGQGWLRYENRKILDLLFNEIEKIAKKEKAMFLRIDPAMEMNSRWFHSGDSPVEPKCKSCAKGSTALSGLWSQHYGFKKSSSEIQPKDTLMLDLKKSEEELLKEMKQKTRYNIRLAERKGVKVISIKYQIPNTKYFEKFWKLVEETTKRDKFTSHSKEYYWKMLESLGETQNFAGAGLQLRGFHSPNGAERSEAVEPKMQDLQMRFHSSAETMEPSKADGYRRKILNQVQDDKDQVQNDSCSCSQKLQARLYLAEYENKTIAANIVLYFGDMAVYLHGASSSKHRNLMAPYLLQWRQIMDAKNAGCKKYDFWGITSKSQITNHKSQINSKFKIQNSKFNSWGGITRFKKGFGGYEKNYIGAYDLVFDNIGYMIYGFIKFIKSKVR